MNPINATPMPGIDDTLNATHNMMSRMLENVHPPLWQSLGLMALYAMVGVLVAIAGYKLFDLCTPGDLHKEIVESKNIAAAIVGGAIIIGVSIIVAACIVG